MLADIQYKTGPPSIRNENGQLVGFVFVDLTTSDIDGYVRAAIAEDQRGACNFPPGYYMQWAGQFEYLKAAEARLKVVIPFTLLIIFVLIYLNTQSVAKTAIVLLAVPFSLIGAFWLLYLLGYNMSVAVWVGLIALAGLDAETGVVMLLYLDHAWEERRARGRMNSMDDLYAAVKEGAVQRIRPKIMTVCAILFGLLPILWSPATQSGRRRDEAHRHADDRRHRDQRHPGAAHLPGHLRVLEAVVRRLKSRALKKLSNCGREHSAG